MIFTQKQAKEQIQTLESRIEELEADAQAHASTVESLQEQIADKDSEIACKVQTIEELTTAKESSESRVAELETQLEETQESVSQEVVTQIATVGQPEPVEINEEGEELDTFTQYRKLQSTDGRAATKFWNEHIAPNLK